MDLLFLAQAAWTDLETELKKSVRSADIPSTSIKEVRAGGWGDLWVSALRFAPVPPQKWTSHETRLLPFALA